MIRNIVLVLCLALTACSTAKNLSDKKLADALNNGGGTKGLSNLDDPQHMYLFYENERGNDQYIVDMVQVVNTYNGSQKKEKHITVTVYAENKPAIESALKSLVAANKSLAQVKVELLNAPLANAWPQDAGEFVWRDSEALFLDIHQGSAWSQELVKALAREHTVLNLPYDSKKSSEDTANEGGNIEALPGGELYAGDTLTTSMIQNLSKLHETVILPTKQLSVGHVDDLFAVIPVDAGSAASKGCEFAILKADTAEGIKLLLSASVLGQGEEPTSQNFIKALAWVSKDPTLAQSSNKDKKKWGAFLDQIPQLIQKVTTIPPFTNKKGAVSFEEWYVAKAVLVQRDVQIGLTKLKDKAALSNPKCAQVSDISVPVIFGGEQYGELAFSGQPATDADFLNSAVNFANPFLNLVVLGKYLAVPDYSTYVQSLIAMPMTYSKSEAVFKKAFAARLAPYGIRSEKIRYVDSTGYLVGMGGTHSGSLIQRRPSQR